MHDSLVEKHSLSDLKVYYSRTASPQKSQLPGLEALGKTQVVLELAYRARERYPNSSVLWLPAINAESLQQAYLEAGRQLGIRGLEEEWADVKEACSTSLESGEYGTMVADL